MKIGVLTSSYKTNAIEVREKLAVSEPEVRPLIDYLKAKCGLKEVMVVSTCNRVEIYFRNKNPMKKFDSIAFAFTAFKELDPTLEINFTRLMEREAINHIFRVAASLEAMVIGEPQITGQIKNFFHLSVEAGGCGFLINQVVNRAFVTAKRVRTETSIARFAVSISFAAVELAKKIFFELKDKTILVVGAGEMAELAISNLMKAGCSQLLVTNRTFSRAVALAEQFNGSAVRFEYLANHLKSADIIISSTGAKGFVLTHDILQDSMKKRKFHPMFLIDIAVPRDIDPAVNQISNTYVYDIDDLQSVVDNNLQFRQQEAEKAQLIIEEELDKIDQWLATLDVIPTVKQFREKILDLANEELSRGLGQMGDISAKQERTVRAMINGLAYKVLHHPTIILKQAAKDGIADEEYIRILNDLFDLTPPPNISKKNNVIKLK
ncbi:MAG: glutamyl-tRNA reductase [Deltaproteobacteria bacterium]|jgi:glutamyl-tRNA reductase|nr:glutamyl-tRNA reductase [Deltaproteobacteria bacterium]